MEYGTGEGKPVTERDGRWLVASDARALIGYDPVLFGFSGPRPARGSVLHYVMTFLVMLLVDKTFVLKFWHFMILRLLIRAKLNYIVGLLVTF